LATLLDAFPNLLIVDEDEDERTIEETAEELVDLGSRQKSRGLVLVADSLQTIRTSSASDASTPKERMDAVTKSLKQIARRTGALVIVTSELAHSAYRSQKANERTAPMAAFKESGAIEYAMTIG